jgi:hypothetical protein
VKAICDSYFVVALLDLTDKHEDIRDFANSKKTFVRTNFRLHERSLLLSTIKCDEFVNHKFRRKLILLLRLRLHVRSIDLLHLMASS